ncbi:MAG: DUF1622 domain-containing protein [ANME-2 cluster archaeon]|nr:DUF1622 domain-containing protein [ANME-2 cluster archaeon]MCL7474689.1 DUF1622 domain-containing protein [ANME-2 cluster archaeon]MDF1531480.1 DUF1622 domain-containing protein [ANME-2 cluster archaeon]MDW7776533.1 DUF1622 domain-containing protein [Methanosarcinales archaeon]
MFEFVIDISSKVFASIGAVIILYGGALAAINTLKMEIRRTSLNYHDVRRDFTHKIIFGLDFLIAGDILKTIVAPTQDELILLGAIVIIRTILGYFLGKEAIEFDH